MGKNSSNILETPNFISNQLGDRWGKKKHPTEPSGRKKTYTEKWYKDLHWFKVKVESQDKLSDKRRL